MLTLSKINLLLERVNTGFRNSFSQMCYRIVVLKSFEKFLRKTHVSEFFFNKVAGLRPLTLLKKRLRHRSFHVNFAKFTHLTCFLRSRVHF